MQRGTHSILRHLMMDSLVASEEAQSEKNWLKFGKRDLIYQ